MGKLQQDLTRPKWVPCINSPFGQDEVFKVHESLSTLRLLQILRFTKLIDSFPAAHLNANV